MSTSVSFIGGAFLNIRCFALTNVLSFAVGQRMPEEISYEWFCSVLTSLKVESSDSKTNILRARPRAPNTTEARTPTPTPKTNHDELPMMRSARAARGIVCAPCLLAYVLPPAADASLISASSSATRSCRLPHRRN